LISERPASRRELLRLAGLAAASLALPVRAHHSFAVFDRGARITLEGVVKEFQWTNPHIFLQLLVPDAQGKEVEWSIEGASPNMLMRRGWTKDSFRPGEKVTVIGNPLRDGGPGANFVFARFPDGRTLGDLDSTVPG
jgi:hypothetical protein